MGTVYERLSPLPGQADATLQMRAIFAGGVVDVVPGHALWNGPKAGTAAYKVWSKRLKAAWPEAARIAKAERWERLRGDVAQDVCLFSDLDGLVINASTNASRGYLYMVAWAPAGSLKPAPKPSKGRVRPAPEASGQRVDVYRNLHNGLWSIRSRERDSYGRVLGHAAAVDVQGARFVVNERGRQKVLATDQKNVHAFVRGRLEACEGCDTPLEQGAYYNPYKVASFVDPHNHDAVLAGAARVRLHANKRVSCALPQWGLD